MTYLTTVRASDGLRQWELTEWQWLVMLAALSAEPETLEEFYDALRRYEPEHRWSERGAEVATVDEAEREQPWCLIDLKGRTLVAGGGCELPERHDVLQAEPDDHAEGFDGVFLNWPSDWVARAASDGWRTEVAMRAKAADRPRIDVRAVLFGEPLYEFLARQILAASKDGPVTNRDVEYKLTKAIHADWLMSAREDLQNRTPRQWLLERMDDVQLDLERRSRQWTIQGQPPRPLSRESFAYRYGPFGLSEVVLYFDLIRSVMAQAWQRVRDERSLSVEQLKEQLQQHARSWLDAPHEDGMSRLTVAELIDSERRRMPVTGNESHGFDDCPICQAMASGDFGPSFLWFDGHHLELEDEYAFSLENDYEQWQSQQEEFEASVQSYQRQVAGDRASTAEGLERDDQLQDRLDVGDAGVGIAARLGEDSVWKSSFVDWEGAVREQGPHFAKLSLSFPLAELVTDLSEQPDGRAHLEGLNQAYAQFRTAQGDVAIRSAARDFRERLEQVAILYPQLTSKSADLQGRLDEVLRK